MIIYEERFNKYKEKMYVASADGLEFAYILDYHKSKYDYRDPYHVNIGNDEKRIEHLGTCKSLIEGKAMIAKWYQSQPKPLNLPELKTKKVNAAAFLPLDGDSEFYPTPSELAGKMLGKVNWEKHRIQYVLEPSAGTGNLCDSLLSLSKARNLRMDETNIDTVEVDENLQATLRGKGYAVVADDFLTCNIKKCYDLILMNPPFSNGDEHLIKAIQMIEQNGGQIVCLLNAETIRNKYTKRRVVLGQMLEKYNASIEFISDAFKHADRKTDVEIAIVHLDIKREQKQSDIWEKLKKAKEQKLDEHDCTAVVGGDWLEQMVQNFNMEVDAGLKLLNEFDALAPYLTDEDGYRPEALIQITVGREKYSSVGHNTVNDYLELVRNKYWRKLFNRPEVRAKMTSKMSDDFESRLQDMIKYDFTMFNIKTILIELQGSLQVGVEDSIISLFDTLSAQYSWFEDSQRTIHYYNGWKTNKAWKVGEKAIIPMNGCFSECWTRGGTKTQLEEYRVAAVIADLERAMNYLRNGEKMPAINVDAALREANDRGATTVEFTYFTCTFYKKGTCHIKFKKDAQPLIDRMNIFASQKKGWLPPSYGKRRYADMDQEEQTVIDEFQGKEQYDKVCNNPDQYLFNSANSTLMLA